MAKSIRDAYGEALKRYGADNQDIVVLDADLSCSTKSAIFGEAFLNRFYNCGISEYAMFGMAGGMAACGKIPFVNTFAVFISTLGALCTRQLLSYSRLNVKLAGAYGGLSDAYDGPSHHSLEDCAIMRSMPGMVVMVASDEYITDWMVRESVSYNGPVYIRLSRDANPAYYTVDTKFEIGKGKTLQDGSDVTIIACGVMVSRAMEAAKLLKKQGVSARVVDMFTIKPIDEELVLKCATQTGAIVTAEEHNVVGGLGSAVAEVLVKNNVPSVMEMVGMQDCHAETGAYNDLMEKYHLTEQDIVAAAQKVINRK